jgi:hypothetical protein
MQASTFLARLLGPALLTVGLGILINRDYYRGMVTQVTDSRLRMFIIAMIGLVAGLAVVLVHNVWTLDWRVLITLLGWINFLRGVVSILFPGQTMAFAKDFVVNGPPVIAVVMVIIGPILIYYGYFA